ncbi:putative galactose oxidase/kelch, beta-propeller, immunoglobulin-like, immunoglobulin E-set [Septoria linicola]|nr:putative galactose oxidase/kelch, beta-propeller, immunoglobulin-like, immunoglobulin E-set [Septoria linicola]
MLFGWSNGSAISVGPSRAMVWYYTQGQGSFGAAGTRTGDGDAMCGVAAMYDAVAGKIHVASGSPDHENSEATSNSFIVTIGAPGTTASTERTTNMAFRRIFATSTILPDGQIFVVGGQSFGVPFSDNNAIRIVVADDEDLHTYGESSTASNIPLHLGPHGRWTQIFTPPYLLRSDGRTAATRPTISAVSARTVKVGNTFTATVRSSGANGSWTFAIMRLGSSTHTVNSDQRRIPLVPISVSNGVYTFRLPADPGICTSGYWWLFAMESGVPSVATELLISP